MNLIEDDKIGPGRAELDIYFVVDYYASYEEDGNTTKKYYLVPVGTQSYIGVEASSKHFVDMEQIMAVSQDYMMGNRDDVEGIYHVKGTIVEMTGDELLYYKQYYSELDWGGEEVFLPYTLRLDHYGSGTMVTLIIFGVLFLLMLVIMLVIIVRMVTGNYQKMVKDYCKKAGNYEQALAKVEWFYSSTQPIHQFRISREFVMAQNGAHTIFLEGKNLLWAYMNVTTHYTNAIKTGTTYSIQLCMRNGKCYVVSMKNEEETQAVLARIHDMLLHVFVGYSDELCDFYHKNRDEMIRESDRMLHEIAMDISVSGMEENADL